jgi:hypothetical protein
VETLTSKKTDVGNRPGFHPEPVDLLVHQVPAFSRDLDSPEGRVPDPEAGEVANWAGSQRLALSA